jgi:hypothetical protein
MHDLKMAISYVVLHPNVLHQVYYTQDLPLGVMASESGGVEPVSVYQLLERDVDYV